MAKCDICKKTKRNTIIMVNAWDGRRMNVCQSRWDEKKMRLIYYYDCIKAARDMDFTELQGYK